MSTTTSLPKLITFDGEARSGKGTIVQATKDYLRDECGYTVMLIDAGQVFRVLVVAATRAGVDMDNPRSIDAFLGNKTEVEASARLVKEVYHMSKTARDALLYTNEVGASSAKIGARPKSHVFADVLLKKWLHDAAVEGYGIVLLDGRALEEVGAILEREGLCEFVLGLYFVCDPSMGARRTLGFADVPYEALGSADKNAVDELVGQIIARNQADYERAVHPVIPPVSAPTYHLPYAPVDLSGNPRPMVIFDTSADMTKADMSLPVARAVGTAISC